MAVTVALAGDTMLGRGVGEEISADGVDALFSGEVRDVFASADLRLLNLECCVSDRGTPWEVPGRPFHFRAPPEAVDALSELRVDCVSMANNHSLDYGHEALTDTRDRLTRAGIQTAGAGANLVQARAPVILEARGMYVAVLAVTDHPPEYAAADHRPGVAYAALHEGVPTWLTRRIRALARTADVVLVTPHWGPNMSTGPLPYVRAAAGAMIEAGATLVAGHSAHVFHGVAGRVLYDLGDFIDDYAVNDMLRNDLGLLFLVTVDTRGPVRITGVPLRLEYARTRLAVGAEAAWIRDRLSAACAEFGTTVTEEDGRLSIRPAGT